MYKYLWICLFGLLASYAPVQAREQKICSGDKETLDCLKENFTELYEDQYMKFLIIIGKAQKEAMNCTSADVTASYLDVVGLIGDNMEVEEGLRDQIETRFLKDSPVCLLDALLKTSKDAREIILGRYLQKPMYIKKAAVDSFILKYSNDEKYREMLRPYLPK